MVFLITRSKNDNTVVYRSKCESGKLIAEDPIEVYWMGFLNDLDASNSNYVDRISHFNHL